MINKEFCEAVGIKPKYFVKEYNNRWTEVNKADYEECKLKGYKVKEVYPNFTDKTPESAFNRELFLNYLRVNNSRSIIFNPFNEIVINERIHGFLFQGIGETIIEAFISFVEKKGHHEYVCINIQALDSFDMSINEIKDEISKVKEWIY